MRNLAEMTNIGLPVPQGFTITTEACTQYYEDGREINRRDSWSRSMSTSERWRRLPARSSVIWRIRCLVSVRSGARASMPGMMDTILNLGLNEDVVECYLLRNPAILVGHGTVTEDSFRCTPTLLWKSAKSTLRSSDRSR